MSLRFLTLTLSACALSGACKDEAPASPATKPASATADGPDASGRVLHLIPSATWGTVEVKREEATTDADTDTFTVTFALAPSSPVIVRVPRGDTIELAALPAPADAAPLDAKDYEFALLPAQGTPTGFRFATTARAGDEPFELSVTRTGEDAYQLAGRVAGHPLDAAVEGVADCRDPSLAGSGADRGESPAAAGAAAALTRELDAHLGELEGGDLVLRVVLRVLGRRLVDVDRLRARVTAPPCGVAMLELVCANTACDFEQQGQRHPLKRGDSLSMGTGTTTTFTRGSP